MPSIFLSGKDSALKPSHLATGHPSVPSAYGTLLAPMQVIKHVTFPELAEIPECLGSPTLTPHSPQHRPPAVSLVPFTARIPLDHLQWESRNPNPLRF